MSILDPDEIVRDTYLVERLLGEGAFAQVYRVKHRYMGRQAMKVFKAPCASNEEIEQSLSEALLLSQLKHPNIVEIYDANVFQKEYKTFGYFTMNYMPGGTLERYWRSFGAKLMPVAQAVEVIRKTTRGLSIAHSQNPPIVHRDIKPANILVRFEDSGIGVRLSDFGLAKSVNPLSLLASSRGDLAFKPPEALENQDSCAADIWAVGTTLYLILTDELPYPMLNFRDATDGSRFLRPIRPPSLYNATVDGALESVLFRCLAARSSDRYANATELLRDLDGWRPGRTSSTTSTSLSERNSKRGIGSRSDHDLKAEAQQALHEAIRLAEDPAKLMFAADLLEEAISKDPSLRNEYLDRLLLWRKGIMHVSVRGGRRPRE